MRGRAAGISGKEMGIVLFLFVLAFAIAGFGRARRLAP